MLDARPDHPSTLTPQQRLEEVAAIMARGVLRLLRHGGAAADSGRTGLEVPAECCPDLTIDLTPRESAESAEATEDRSMA